jgi:Putative metallopeptidase
MMECKAINAWYKRENFKPSVTICYELLKHILPNETSAAGVTPPDAAVGQFLWVTLHEVGHATFDILKVPIFGHPEDAADNFATYVLLQFGQGQARPLIEGAAWAWRAYLADYKRNPVVPADHTGPQDCCNPKKPAKLAIPSPNTATRPASANSPNRRAITLSQIFPIKESALART